MSTALKLQGRIALITGSTSGIGLSVAKRLAEDGARVIVSSRKEENVQHAVKNLKDQGFNVSGVACHVGNAEQRKNLIKEAERLGGLDILVQSAGVNPFVGSLFDCPQSAWEKTIDVNLTSSFLLTKEALHLLKKSKFGRVVYNSSIAGYSQFEALGSYAVAKAGLFALTRMAALHLGHWNITCNCVVPGLIETPFGEVVKTDEALLKSMWAFSAIKRIGKPEEVAGLVAFLASDEASYITGESIVVSGGFSSRL